MADVATAPRLVLASASPRRAELLARLGVHPELRPVDVEETPRPGEAGADLVVRLAAAKAAAAASSTATPGHLGAVDGVVAAGSLLGDEVVLAADTEVVLDGRALGKPRDDAEAAGMLRALAGRTHDVLTGLAVRRGDVLRDALVATQVTFRPLTDAEIAWYVGTGEPAGKAGAYGLQGAGAVLVAELRGSDTNVIGLPLAETVALLRAVGLDLLTPSH